MQKSQSTDGKLDVGKDRRSCVLAVTQHITEDGTKVEPQSKVHMGVQLDTQSGKTDTDIGQNVGIEVGKEMSEIDLDRSKDICQNTRINI
jgi:hypothetical protein